MMHSRRVYARHDMRVRNVMTRNDSRGGQRSLPQG